MQTPNDTVSEPTAREKELEQQVLMLKHELKNAKADLEHYATLAVSLVKRVLVAERKFARRFVYPEEYE